MHVRRRDARGSRSAVLATVVAVAISVGAASATAAPPSPPERISGPSGSDRLAADNRGSVRVTLITGDRVTVNAKGEAVGIDPAPGRKRFAFHRWTIGGRAYVIPADAARLVSQGIVDRRLFDVTTLSRPEYVAAAHRGLGLIVTYRGARPAARAQVHEAGDTKVVHTLKQINGEAVTTPERDMNRVWAALTAPTGTGVDLVTAPGISKVWLNSIHQATLDKSVPQIGAPAAWAAGYDGKGIKVAVLDTGIDRSHADLAGQVIANKDFSDSGSTRDLVGHGTHVASIIAGTGARSGGKFRGVATGARILNAKVLNDGGFGDDASIIAGMEWATTKGARIVNLSLGGGDTPGIDPLEETVNRLSAGSGTLFVIAAGNEGESGDSTVGSPGSADAALTVGAVSKEDELALFSSRGPRVGDGAIKPDLTAPGVAITAASAPGSLIADEFPSAVPGYVTISGTSMATPHVAGAAAILAQEHPDWKGDRLKAVLTASTAPGPYTVFEQGTGRVDVAAAIKQSIVAENPSLFFGTQLWPHTDDRPVPKTLTYRNLGTENVTLDLRATVTGPDGKAAPEGLFRLSTTRLPVPAGGQAQVTATLNTRIGTLDGAYSGYVVAAGAGQSVRTSVAAEREVESYTVTMKHFGRSGKPTARYFSGIIGLSGPNAGVLSPDFYNKSGTVSVRIPKGTYTIDSTIFSGTDNSVLNWVVRPVLAVTKNTKITIDARTAKPVALSIPDTKATQLFASVAYNVILGQGAIGGYFLDDGTRLRTAHLGPKVAPGRLNQQVQAAWIRGSTEYNVAYDSYPAVFATGFTKRTSAKEFAKITVKLGAPAKNKLGQLAFIPNAEGGLGTGQSVDVELPATRTIYATTAHLHWDLDFHQTTLEADLDPTVDKEAHYWLNNQSYKAGKSYRSTFNTGVFGPRLGRGYGILRHGDQIIATLPLLADGTSHAGRSTPYDKAATTLYRNGNKLVTVPDALGPDTHFTVPTDRAQYRLSTSLTRSKVADVSTRVSATWTFSSEKTELFSWLPTSIVRFTPTLSVRSTAKARAVITVPVTVQGAAAGRNLRSLKVYVSLDAGGHWKRLAVKHGAVKVTNPKAGQGVSLKAEITDKQGNTLSQTIINAYRAK